MANTPVSLIIRKSLAESGGQPARVLAIQEVLSNVVPRDAGKLLNLHAEVVSLQMKSVGEEELLSSLSPADLSFFLRANDQPPGLCVISSSIAAALIDVQITRQVLAAGSDRAPTATDCAVIGEMIDRWLASAEHECDAAELPIGLTGYKRASMFSSLRECELELEPGEYQALTLTLSLAEGVVEGVIKLFIPCRREQRTHNVGQIMHQHVNALRSPLSAVLMRKSFSYDRIQNVSVNDVFEIPMSALDDVILEDIDGGAMAEGRLGQMNGMRAIRINLGTNGIAAPLPEFEPPSLAIDKTEIPDEDAQLDTVVPQAMDEDGEATTEKLPDLQDLPELPELPELPPI